MEEASPKKEGGGAANHLGWKGTCDLFLNFFHGPIYAEVPRWPHLTCLTTRACPFTDGPPLPTHPQVSAKVERELCSTVKDCTALQEAIAVSNQARQAAVHAQESLKTQADKEQAAFEEEIRVLKTAKDTDEKLLQVMCMQNITESIRPLACSTQVRPTATTVLLNCSDALINVYCPLWRLKKYIYDKSLRNECKLKDQK